MLLFAYGSNLASGEVGDGARFAGPALLPDHRLALTRRSIRWGGGVVDVVAARGEHVWGAAYKTTPESLARLDTKEGAGFAYRRLAVRVDAAR